LGNRPQIKTKKRRIFMDPINTIDLVNNPRQLLFVIGMNLLILVELCAAMYLAASGGDDLTATFMKAFFGMLIPTLVIGVLAKRRLRPAPAARAHQQLGEQRLSS
jgi:hypothetical protein